MSDMIERVEAVISEKLMATWSSESPLAKAALRQLSTTLARATIEAMREPTDLMEGATSDIVVGTSGEYGESNIYCSDYVANKIWQAMIDAELDAALKGEAE